MKGYLDRGVSLESFAKDSFVASEKIVSSVFFIALDRDADDESIKWVEKLLLQDPLSVFFWGEDARYFFDQTLDILQYLDGHRHVMTGFSEDRDCLSAVESFFYACLPDPDRFDCWSGYSFIVADQYFANMSEAVETFLNRRSSD